MLSLGLTSAGCEVSGGATPWQKPQTDCDVILLHWLDSLFRDKKSKSI